MAYKRVVVAVGVQAENLSKEEGDANKYLGDALKALERDWPMLSVRYIKGTEDK